MNTYTRTADQIKALADTEARDLLVSFGAQLGGSDRWVTDVAAQLGVDRRTVQQWKGGYRRAPDLALVAMQALLRAKHLQDFANQVALTIRAATQLGEI